jgi:predicted flap endonuclease-1-like 5' DNA nuclease
MLPKFRLRYLLIGLLVLLWWWLRRQEGMQERPAQTKPLEIEVPPEAPSAPAAARYEAVIEGEPQPERPEPAEPEPDDLKRIEGIGPKIASVLNEAGIESFEQLAALSAGQIREVLSARSIWVAHPDTWPEQASLAADGDWDGLEALKGQLKGGRRI